jgi:carbamoyl-phosphate synthase large subunit
VPNAQRPWYIRYALKSGISVDEINRLTNIDRWFLDNLSRIVQVEDDLRTIESPADIDRKMLLKAKQFGFADRQLAHIWSIPESEVRKLRKQKNVVTTYKAVDTCAAEFEAYTPYYYSTYELEDEIPPKAPGKKRIMILGGGPNRIGQGIEFDYCCCHASYALRELGIESVMVNSNPETVSTDYDTSDLLFFEPLTVEDVLNICDCVQPDGVIVQFGGQTPLNLAKALKHAGIPIIGTSVETIDATEDREKFQQLLQRLGLMQPANGIARTLIEAREVATQVGFPSLVRPSYVLGGRAMEICYDQSQLEAYVTEAFLVAQGQPVLVDRFLEEAIEVDVDCICDGHQAVVAGVMEHIEEAGVHSGDSACSIPPYSLPAHVVDEICQATQVLARHLNVVGLMNVQFAVKKEGDALKVYVLEVNPRASRTVPFVAKATGAPIAAIAAKVMVGMTLAELGFTAMPRPNCVSVKESVFPFRKFPGVDIVLGPEMRSTGEVMGISQSFPIAFAKSQLAAGVVLPTSGKIFVSVANSHKERVVSVARQLHDMGYCLISTQGTAERLEAANIPVERVKKIVEGHPNLIDHMKNNSVDLILNTPSGKGARTDEGRIRATAVQHGVPCITTIQAAEAAVLALAALREEPMEVQSLQERLSLQATQ